MELYLQPTHDKDLLQGLSFLMKILPLLLLLGGCATPLDELYLQRTACLGLGAECEDLHKEIDKRERNQERRIYDNLKRCPGRYIEYCDQTMFGCGRRHKTPRDQFTCVTPEQLRQATRSIL